MGMVKMFMLPWIAILYSQPMKPSQLLKMLHTNFVKPNSS